MKHGLIILIIVGLWLPILTFALPSFAQQNLRGFAQDQPISPPETLEGAKEIGERALETIPKELPGTVEKIWKEEVLPIWQKMYDWFLSNIWPKIKGWFKKEVEPRAKEEIEKRKEIIGEGLEREKEELKKEVKEEIIPKTFDSLWEKFKELIK